jgi:hypothetical protein
MSVIPRPVYWSATGVAPFHASPEIVDGVAVVTMTGLLGPHALASSRSALDTVLRHRPVAVVLDLRKAVPDDASGAVCEALRHYIERHGSRIWLASAPSWLRHQLQTAQVVDHYHWQPTLEAALQAAVAPVHRWSAGRTAPMP